MSDDLVKRLRNTPNWKREEYGDYKSAMVHYDRAPFEAADRIEELEAKLAKAVKKFSEIRQHCDNFGRGVPSIDERIVERCEETAANALAELKGQNDGS